MTKKRANVYDRVEIKRKREVLHKQLANDPKFQQESKELDRRIENGERSSDSIPASELRKRLRGEKLQ